jgi:hypothetical protein
MAQAETAMRTSSAATSGEGISRNCSGCVVTGAGPDKTQAFMVETGEILPLATCAAGKLCDSDHTEKALPPSIFYATAGMA